jgi:MFS family permease
MSAASAAPASKPLYVKLGRRALISTIVTLIGVVPSLVLLAITKEPAVTWATGAFILGFVALLMGGTGVATYTAFITAIATPVAIVVGGTPIAGAAFMALLCLTLGRMSHYGLHRATLLVPIFMAWMIISPPFWGADKVVDRTDGTFLAWMAITFFVGGIFPVLVFPHFLRKLKMPAPKPNPRSESAPYTIVITVLCTSVTYWVLADTKQYAGAWLISTILVLVQVGDVGTVSKTIQRVVGTLLGMLVVSVLVLEVHSLVLLYVIGLVFGIAALTAKFSPHYWVYMALITPTIICFTASSSTQVKNLGEQRAQDVLIGAALVLLASAITIGYSHISKRHGHAPTQDVPAVAGVPVGAA